MKKAWLFVILAAALAGCGKPQPPVGKWEGGYESGGDLVVARVEILPSGQVRVMAPDITNAMGSREQMNEFRARLSADLACHIVELIERLQYPERYAGRPELVSRFAPIEPLPGR
jgi:hypothetical protein